jgi:phage tail-like protein
MAYNKQKLMEFMYQNRLPSVYQKEDVLQKPVPLPLKRFLDIADVGYNYMQDKIESIYNLYDIDKCPAEFLPLLASTVGFEFPYDMSEKERRAFLKALPTLYRNKGNKTLFKYLGRVIFGNDTSVDAVRYNPTVDHPYNLIELVVTVDGDIIDFDKQTLKYKAFAEKFRPVNHKLNVLLSMFYSEVYDSASINDDSSQDLTLFVNDEDIYDTAQMVESDSYTIYLSETDSYTIPNIDTETSTTFETETDTYNTQVTETEDVSVMYETETDIFSSSNLLDSLDIDVLYNTEVDAYNVISSGLALDDSSDVSFETNADSYIAITSDSSHDLIINLGSFLGDIRPTGRLGAGFKLGREDTTTLLAENTI